MSDFTIGSRSVGDGHPCYIIAEAGVNHDGDLAVAHELVDRAAEAGADAVKFQSFTPEDLVSTSAPSATYQRRQGGSDRQYDLLSSLTLPPQAWAELAAHAAELGLTFLCTAFDPASADVLDDLDVVALKVPSGELDNLAFIADLAARDRPLIISTGMSTEDEVRAALVAATGAPAVLLLHCVSAYPAPSSSANLRVIPAMASMFGVPVGWSDHTIGSTTAVAARALGAVMLEKHLTLDRARPGPDHAASADPEGFRAYVQAVRETESALGDGTKQVADVERENRVVVRRSYHARRALVAGDTLSVDAVVLVRPAVGLPPATDLATLVIARPVAAGEPIRDADVVVRGAAAPDATHG